MTIHECPHMLQTILLWPLDKYKKSADLPVFAARIYVTQIAI